MPQQGETIMAKSCHFQPVVERVPPQAVAAARMGADVHDYALALTLWSQDLAVAYWLRVNAEQVEELSELPLVLL